MGGDLSDAPAGQVADLPRRRAEGPDRRATSTAIQIVKGWLDAKGGKLQEKVYDVAWSRRPQARREERQAADGRQHRGCGERDLDQHHRRARTDRGWKDPDFDASQPAFYYGRVIEIPTPRWTAYDAKRSGNKPLPGTAMTITERAYTSPIWYTPGK